MAKSRMPVAARRYIRRMEEKSAQYRRLMARLAHERRMAWTDGRVTVASLTMFRETAVEAGLPDPERLVLELCDRLIANAAPAVSQSARYFKAVALWERGLPTLATAELETLEDCDATVYLATEVAEFWAYIGDCERALAWYARALSIDCPPGGPEGQDRRLAAKGRTALRTRLGLGRDDLDFAMFQEDLEARERRRRICAASGQVVLTAYFPRSEIQRAEDEGLLDPGDGADIYHYRSELYWQLDAENRGIVHRHLIPLSAAEMRAVRALPAGDVRQIGTREFYLNDLVERGYGIAWPPDDSAPCWCASQRPYASCCGRPRR